MCRRRRGGRGSQKDSWESDQRCPCVRWEVPGRCLSKGMAWCVFFFIKSLWLLCEEGFMEHREKQGHRLGGCCNNSWRQQWWTGSRQLQWRWSDSGHVSKVELIGEKELSQGWLWGLGWMHLYSRWLFLTRSSQTSHIFLLRSFCPPGSPTGQASMTTMTVLSYITHLCAALALTNLGHRPVPTHQASVASPPKSYWSDRLFPRLESDPDYTPRHESGTSSWCLQFQGTYFKASLTRVGISK